MALSKSQRYLFRMEAEPDRKNTVPVLIRKATGAAILMCLSFAAGKMALATYLPVSNWLFDLLDEVSLSIFLWPLAFSIGAYIIALIPASVAAILFFHDIVDISGNFSARISCSCIVLTPFAHYFYANEGGPTIVPILFACFLYLALDNFSDMMLVDNFLSAAQYRQEIREIKNIEAAINKLNDPSDIAAIAIETKDSRIACLALGHINDQNALAVVALKTKQTLVARAAIDGMTDSTTILKIVENATNTELRQYACKRLGHVFDTQYACCSRCGETPGNREHDWAGNLCKRCGTEKHVKTRVSDGDWVPRASIDDRHWDTHDGIEYVFVPRETVEYEEYVYHSKAERDPK